MEHSTRCGVAAGRQGDDAGVSQEQRRRGEYTKPCFRLLHLSFLDLFNLYLFALISTVCHRLRV